VGQPKVTPAAVGASLKVLRAEGDAGDLMPEHATSLEAVATVLNGKAEVVLEGEPHRLGAGDALVIPAGVPHTLELHEDGTLVQVIMPLESQISFL